MVRDGRIFSECDDRFERTILRTALSHEIFEISRRLIFGNPLFEEAQKLRKRLFRDLAGAGNTGKLLLRLDGHCRNEGGHTVDQFEFAAQPLVFGLREPFHGNGQPLDLFAFYIIENGCFVFGYGDAGIRVAERFLGTLRIPGIGEKHAFLRVGIDKSESTVKSRQPRAQIRRAREHCVRFQLTQDFFRIVHANIVPNFQL